MTKENLRMSIKEANRFSTMRQVDKKTLTLQQASEELGISLRQAKRIRKRYISDGEKGLISKKRGAPSTNKRADISIWWDFVHGRNKKSQSA